MSKSQLQCFILSTPTCVNIRFTHPRCLLSLPLSVLSCLPILSPDMRVLLLSNVIRSSRRYNLSVSSSRKWERKLESGTSPSLAVTSHQMSAGTSHPILNESLLSGLTGEGCEKQVFVFRYTVESLDRKQLKALTKTKKLVV